MNCIVCGSEQSRLLYRGLVQCLNCDFVWADQPPTDSELEHIYDDNYFFGGEYPDYPAEETTLKRNFAAVLQRLARFVPQGQLFEIGCAYGFFLDIARHRYEVTGVDINTKACQHIRKYLGLQVYCGDFLALPLPKENFDAVVCLATLEHLSRPDRYIEKARQILKPSGVFVCSTCDRGSLFARLCGPRWRLIHPPTHISYFSQRTLIRLLNNIGFAPVHISRLWWWRRLDVILTPLSHRNQLTAKLYRAARAVGLTRIEFPFSLGDDIFLIARKKTDSKTTRE